MLKSIPFLLLSYQKQSKDAKKQKYWLKKRQNKVNKKQKTG